MEAWLITSLYVNMANLYAFEVTEYWLTNLQEELTNTEIRVIDNDSIYVIEGYKYISCSICIS